MSIRSLFILSYSYAYLHMLESFFMQALYLLSLETDVGICFQVILHWNWDPFTNE